MDALDLTVVVPAFEEAGRIREPLKRIADHLVAGTHAAEIVVVDDGSRDATRDAVREVAAGFSVPTRLLGYDRNRGKGYALAVGFAAARGNRILFTDADLSTPIDELERLLARLDAGADVVIGSRKNAEAQVLEHQPWLRETLGKGFTLLVNLTLTRASDVTCGFKLFRAETGRDLFSRVRILDWGFDAEVLFLAERSGARVDEVGVRWEDCEGTKVRLLRDVVGSLLGLVRIRWNAFRGVYADAVPPRPAIEVYANPAARPASAPVEAGAAG
jgi:dolichyl-phosphate beta-glucosyltransferase